VRNLFICFLLATMVYLAQRGPDPLTEPSTYLGIMLVIPILGARLFRNWRLPPPVGAIAAGFMLGPTGLLSPTVLETVEPFIILAFTWVGMHLGVTCARPIALNRRSLIAAAAPVIGCTLTGTVLFSWLYPLDLREALRVGLLASMTAPIFVQLTTPQRREPLAQAVLVSLIALFLLGLTALPELKMPDLTKFDLALGVVAVLLLELGNRCYRAVRTEPGRYVLFILFCSVLAWLSVAQDIHPLLLGGAFGVIFGLRAHSYREGFRPLEESSVFLGPFLLGSLAAGLQPHRLLDLGPLEWEFCLIYLLTLVVGKTIGGILGSRVTGAPLGIWALSYAQGVGLPLLLPAIVPARLFLSSHAHDPVLFVTGLMLLAGVLPALAVSLSTGLGRGSGGQPVILRERAAASGGIGLI
jgi:Kef-type K+ transport system membrane component KefB